MKKLWAGLSSFTRWLLVTLLILAIVGGVAYAIYSKSVPSHIKVITPPEEEPEPTIALEFYEDEACTTVTTFVEWGNVEQGDKKTMTIFYTKNVGEASVEIEGKSNLPPEVGKLDIQFEKATLSVGEVTKTEGILKVKSDAPLGDVDFDIIVNAERI